MNRTKIICTVGPSVDSDKKIAELVRSGMSVARINCSHGDLQSRLRHLKRIRKIEKRLKQSIGIMLDLQGPKLRVGDLPNPYILNAKETWQLAYDKGPDEKQNIIPIPFQGLPKAVVVGQKIYMDDGLIQTEVIRKEGQSVWVRVVYGGVLESRKGINIPHYRGKLPILRKKDRIDLAWGLRHKVDFIALSFVRKPQDIRDLKKVIAQSKTRSLPLVIAKIEKPEAVEQMEGIIEESDGILIARGDLGIELPSERVPVVQKQLIESCRVRKKPVIVATQMLDSMRSSPVPTRAEASDVASAIYAGVDAALLTGETSSGKYPVEACAMMQKIILEVEQHMIQKTFRKTPADFGVTTLEEAFMFNAMQTADDIGARAIVLSTRQGTLTKVISKMHPKQPIFSLAATPTAYRQLNLYWGVFPINMTHGKADRRIVAGLSILKKKGTVQKGDRLIFLYREHLRGHRNITLNLKIVTVE
ncbi:MAG: pyruvate kinase [Deltaproteobacteria bacterium]|nr:pyruvate kinase [Deltaproteobacteria bacterium]